MEFDHILPLAVAPMGNVQDGSYTGCGEGVVLTPEEVSDKVLGQINDVSRLLGVTFEGYEQEAMTLFSAIEATWRSKMYIKDDKQMTKGNKLDRELRKLECSVNYDQTSEERGRKNYSITQC